MSTSKVAPARVSASGDAFGTPNPPDQNIFEFLFHKFCSSSTIHGTYFWTQDINFLSKLAWIFIVILGISSSTWIIDNSFQGWAMNPVITSVTQIPIEQVPFPSITVCPLETSEFGFVEELINRRPNNQFPYSDVLIETFMTLRKLNHDQINHKHHKCLIDFCNSKINSTDCYLESEFDTFLTKLSTVNHHNYQLEILNDIISIVRNFNLNDSIINENWSFYNQTIGDLNCNIKVNDFIFLRDLRERFRNLIQKDIYPGTLIKWLYLHLSDQSHKMEIFNKYIDRNIYPEAYGDQLGAALDVPFPELARILTKSNGLNADNIEDQMLGENFTFSDTLLRRMRTSSHPPHVAEPNLFQDGLHRVPDPSFPFCWYEDRLQDGTLFGSYEERYCDSFQTTINEAGLCYSYNNVNLGMDDGIIHEQHVYTPRSVKGCGKRKGLRLVIDSQKLLNNIAKKEGNGKQNGFKVYVTVGGVVTHKVPFIVDPNFDGEYNFYLHGIHYITSSDDFREWNKDVQACYYPYDRNLTYFSQYNQDNCLLECKFNKISRKCGCSPWYLNQTDYRVCTPSGNFCFDKELLAYRDDLEDRSECDCRNDCEGVHFFTSFAKFLYEDKSETDQDLWFDSGKGTGRLSKYLMDPDHVFTDPLTTNLTLIRYNVEDFKEIAKMRFSEDIVILNFFFDTPIITQIKLEMRVNFFDKISAIGGTLGLFTGVSLITFAEVFYWGIRFFFALIQYGGSNAAQPKTGLINNDSPVENFPPGYESYFGVG